MVKHIREWSAGDPLLDEVDWNDMTEVLQDKDLSHDHKGLVDSGTKIDHNDLKNVTENQHHPKLHGPNHENTGPDEIDVTGLSGLLADPQNFIPFSSKFRVHQTSNQTITKQVETLLDFHTKVFDILNEFNLATDRFVPQVAGYYLLYAQWALYDGQDNKVMVIYIKKNGTDYLAMGRATMGGTEEDTASTTTIEYLTPSDYIEIVVWHNQTVNQATWAGYGHVFFRGHRLS